MGASLKIRQYTSAVIKKRAAVFWRYSTLWSKAPKSNEKIYVVFRQTYC
jgi:hypothetical protein